jgi:hypothetical protein
MKKRWPEHCHGAECRGYHNAKGEWVEFGYGDNQSDSVINNNNIQMQYNPMTGKYESMAGKMMLNKPSYSEYGCGCSGSCKVGKINVKKPQEYGSGWVPAAPNMKNNMTQRNNLKNSQGNAGRSKGFKEDTTDEERLNAFGGLDTAQMGLGNAARSQEYGCGCNGDCARHQDDYPQKYANAQRELMENGYGTEYNYDNNYDNNYPSTAGGTAAGAVGGFLVGGPIGAVVGGIAGHELSKAQYQPRDQAVGSTATGGALIGAGLGLAGGLPGVALGALAGGAIGGAGESAARSYPRYDTTMKMGHVGAISSDEYGLGGKGYAVKRCM